MGVFEMKLELKNNARVSEALSRNHNSIEVTLEAHRYIEVLLKNLDFGRFDCEGNLYIAQRLGIHIEDILTTDYSKWA